MGHTSPASSNTVHLMIFTASRRLIGGSGLACRGRRGKLLILRLTPRRLRRWRLETTRSWRISSSAALRKDFLRRGGNSAEDGEFAADNPHRMEEGQSVWIFLGFQRGLVH